MNDHVVTKRAVFRVVILSFTCILLLTCLPHVLLAAPEKNIALINWQTNERDPVYAAKDAKRGGKVDTAIKTFPLTLRTVGPDANTVLYPVLRSNQGSLLMFHPFTQNPVPYIATHWALSDDGRTVFYKLNKNVVWSDGVGVSADDFVFTFDFMRSKAIVDPLYNQYYQDEFLSVRKLDQFTIAIDLKRKKVQPYVATNLSPLPRHYFNGTVPHDFVTRYNWKVVPNTGPYDIFEVKKGRSISFKRKNNWWGDELRYFKNRFNVSEVHFKVVRETAVEFEMLRSGELTFMSLSSPEYWYGRKNDSIFTRGLVQKIEFYHNRPRSVFGFWMNRKFPLFRDKEMRVALQHSLHFDKVIKTAMRGEAKRLERYTVGYQKYDNVKITARRYDQTSAGKLLDGLGWSKRGQDGVLVKDGKRLAVEVLYSADRYTDYLLVLQREALKIGFDLILRKLDWSTLAKLTSDGNYQIVLLGFAAGTVPQYWENWHSLAVENLTRISDPSLDKLVEEFRASESEKEKIEFAHRIQEFIHDDAAFVPATSADFTRMAAWRWILLPDQRATPLSTQPFAIFDEQFGGLFWFDEGKFQETVAAKKTGKVFDPQIFVDKTFEKLQ